MHHLGTRKSIWPGIKVMLGWSGHQTRIDVRRTTEAVSDGHLDDAIAQPGLRLGQQERRRQVCCCDADFITFVHVMMAVRCPEPV